MSFITNAKVFLFLAAICASSSGARPLRLVDGALNDTTLSLSDCFDIALRHNAEIRRSAAAVAVTYGEKIESRGRFLPRLDLLYRRSDTTWAESAGVATPPVHDHPLVLEVRQRIAEFGRTSPAEFYRQDRERAALYAREHALIDVFSSIRRIFKGLLVIQQQLAAHDTLLAIYTARMEQANDRLGTGVGLRTAVLTARLNWLDERERILTLQTRRTTSLANLKEALGLAAIPADVRLRDHFTEVVPDEDSCVVLALQRNTEIDDCRHELLQAGRALGQTGWEFLLGDITFSAGMNRDGKSARLELGSGQGTQRRWVIDAVGAKTLIEGSAQAFTPRDTSLRVTASLEVSIPVFRGAQRHGTIIELGARYDEARARLIETTRGIERRTREAYYTYRMSRDLLEIQRERIAIARERYALAETQFEQGRMSDDGLDSFRERLFSTQDAFFAQQFDVLSREENLRALIRLLQ